MPEYPTSKTLHSLIPHFRCRCLNKTSGIDCRRGFDSQSYPPIPAKPGLAAKGFTSLMGSVLRLSADCGDLLISKATSQRGDPRFAADGQMPAVGHFQKGTPAPASTCQALVPERQMNGAFSGHSDATAFTGNTQGATCDVHHNSFLEALDPPERDLPSPGRTVTRYWPI